MCLLKIAAILSLSLSVNAGQLAAPIVAAPVLARSSQYVSNAPLFRSAFVAETPYNLPLTQYVTQYSASVPVARAAPLVAAGPVLAARSAQFVNAAPVVATRAAPLVASAPVVATRAAPLVASAPVVAANAPVVAARAVEFDDSYPQYQFAYNVQDGLTGDSKTQEETRDGDIVKGSYSLIEADGSRRVVNYYADPINGFNAVVSKDVPVAVSPAIVAQKTVVAPAVAPAKVVVA